MDLGGGCTVDVNIGDLDDSLKASLKISWEFWRGAQLQPPMLTTSPGNKAVLGDY